MKSNYGYIYKTINLKNNKMYVGQKIGDFNFNYFGSGKNICRAIKKYGKKVFKLEIIVYAEDRNKLNKLEKQYIKKYRKLFGKRNLYNITDGGEGGDISFTHKLNCVCCFCKAKRGEYKKEGNPMYGTHRFGDKNPMHGKHQSEEARKNIRKGNIEHCKLHGSYKRTETHKKKMGRVRKTQWQDPKYRANQLEASFKRWQDPKFRKKMKSIKRNRKKSTTNI